MKPFCSLLLFLWILVTCALPVDDETGIIRVLPTGPDGRVRHPRHPLLTKKHLWCEGCMGDCLWESDLATCLVHCFRKLGLVCPHVNLEGKPYKETMGPPKPESSDQVPETKGKPPKGPDNEFSFGIWNIIDMVRGNMAHSFSRSTAVGPPRRYRIPTPSRGFR